MAKIIPDAILDLMCDQLRGNTIRVLSSEPANLAGAVSATLATQTIVGTINAAPGSPDGRALVFPQQDDVDITVTGTANHVSIDDTTVLKFATTATPQSLTAGGTVTIPQFTYTLRDVT